MWRKTGSALTSSAAPGRESSPNAGPNAGLGSPTRSFAEKTRDLATLEAVVARAETGAGPTPSSVSPRARLLRTARAPPARASWAPGESFPSALSPTAPTCTAAASACPSPASWGTRGWLRAEPQPPRKPLADLPGRARGTRTRTRSGSGGARGSASGRPRWRAPTAPRAATPPAKTRDAASRERVPAGGVPGFGHATRRAESRKSRRRLGGLGLDAEGPGGDHPRARGRRGRRGLTGVDAQPEPRAVRRERGRVRGAAAVAGVALAALDVARSRRRLRELPGRRELPRAARCAQGVEGVRGRGRGRSREDGAGRARGHERRGVLLTRRVSFLLQTRRRETEKKLFFTSCAATNDQRQERKERTRFRRQRTSASFPAPGLPLRPRASTFRARIHRP